MDTPLDRLIAAYARQFELLTQGPAPRLSHAHVAEVARIHWTLVGLQIARDLAAPEVPAGSPCCPG